MGRNKRRHVTWWETWQHTQQHPLPSPPLHQKVKNAFLGLIYVRINKLSPAQKLILILLAWENDNNQNLKVRNNWVKETMSCKLKSKKYKRNFKTLERDERKHYPVFPLSMGVHKISTFHVKWDPVVLYLLVNFVILIYLGCTPVCL